MLFENEGYGQTRVNSYVITDQHALKRKKGLNLNRTHTYTYFGIGSNGEIKNNKGLVAFEKGVFDPEDLTRILEI